MSLFDDLKTDLATLRAEVQQLSADVRWLKLLVGGVALATLSPKFGGPAPSDAVSTLLRLVA